MSTEIPLWFRVHLENGGRFPVFMRTDWIAAVARTIEPRPGIKEDLDPRQSDIIFSTGGFHESISVQETVEEVLVLILNAVPLPELILKQTKGTPS